MNGFWQWLSGTWNKVKSSPIFVTASSAAFGAVMDIAQDYVTNGHIDTTPAGLKKMTGYVVATTIAAIVHLYRPSPPKQ